MQASERSDDVLYFLCGGCGSELSVPVALHGIDGPCPCCGQTLRAPELVLPPLPPAAVSLPPLDRRHESWQNTESIPVPQWMNLEAGAPGEWEPAPGENGASYVLPAASQDRLRFFHEDPFAKAGGLSGTGGFQAKLTISSLAETPDDAIEASPRVLHDRETKGKPAAPFPAFRLVRVALLVTTGGLCAALVLFLKDRQWVLDLPWQPDEEASMAERPFTPAPAVPSPLEPGETKDLPNPFLAEDPFGLEQVTRPVMATPLPGPAALSGTPPPIASGKK